MAKVSLLLALAIVSSASSGVLPNPVSGVLAKAMTPDPASTTPFGSIRGTRSENVASELSHEERGPSIETTAEYAYGVTAHLYDSASKLGRACNRLLSRIKRWYAVNFGPEETKHPLEALLESAYRIGQEEDRLHPRLKRLFASKSTNLHQRRVKLATSKTNFSVQLLKNLLRWKWKPSKMIAAGITPVEYVEGLMATVPRDDEIAVAAACEKAKEFFALYKESGLTPFDSLKQTVRMVQFRYQQY